MRYYATLGPACCEASALAALLRRGVSGFRLNGSHTMLAARRDWIDALHDAERSTGLAAQLMIDLRGPEVRIGALPSPLTLTAGEAVTLGADIPVEKDVLAALVPGMTVLLDDGAMALTVLDGGRCRVTRGGVLTGHKSLTPEGTELHRPALCEADLADLAQAAALGVSAVMQPFVRSADDLRTVRQAMAENGLARRPEAHRRPVPQPPQAVSGGDPAASQHDRPSHPHPRRGTGHLQRRTGRCGLPDAHRRDSPGPLSAGGIGLADARGPGGAARPLT